MIKLTKISPLNTSKDLYFEREVCENGSSIYLANSVINTDNQGNPEPYTQMDEFVCPKCGAKLNKKSKINSSTGSGQIKK